MTVGAAVSDEDGSGYVLFLDDSRTQGSISFVKGPSTITVTTVKIACSKKETLTTGTVRIVTLPKEEDASASDNEFSKDPELPLHRL